MSKVEMDCDVRNIAEWMQERISADRLVGVARVIGDLAPIIWGHYGCAPIRALSVKADPISHEGHNMQPVASEPILES
jgi:hypothetical protein